MPKYKIGDLVSIHIKTTKRIGSDTHFHGYGIIEKYSNGVYYVVNPKIKGDWCFATEDELIKYPDYVKKSWLKKGD